MKTISKSQLLSFIHFQTLQLLSDALVRRESADERHQYAQQQQHERAQHRQHAGLGLVHARAHGYGHACRGVAGEYQARSSFFLLAYNEWSCVRLS